MSTVNEVVERVRKTLFPQATLVETGAMEIAKTLFPCAADSILTIRAFPPDPNVQGYVCIGARAEIKTLPFATKVAWGNKVLQLAFPVCSARHPFQCTLRSLRALRDTISSALCVRCVLCATLLPMNFAFAACFARHSFQCLLRALRALRDTISLAGSRLLAPFPLNQNFVTFVLHHESGRIPTEQEKPRWFSMRAVCQKK